MKKTALVLSGGGFAGAYQVGALSSFKENWNKVSDNGQPLHFDLVAGVSVGSLNGAMIAMNKFDELLSLWNSIKDNYEAIYTTNLLTIKNVPSGTVIAPNISGILKKLLPAGIFLSALKFLFNRQKFIDSIGNSVLDIPSLTDNTPLFLKLENYIHKADFKTPYYCGFVSLTDSNYYSTAPEDFATDTELQKAILASTGMPIYWPPVETIQARVNNKTTDIKICVDGGIRNVSPLGDVIKYITNLEAPDDDWTIYIVNCNSKDLDYACDLKGLVKFTERSMVEIMTNEIFSNDIDQFVEINDLVAQVELAKKEGKVQPDFNLVKKDAVSSRNLRHFKMVLIQPETHSMVGDSLDSSSTAINMRLINGKNEADKQLSGIN